MRIRAIAGLDFKPRNGLSYGFHRATQQYVAGLFESHTMIAGLIIYKPIRSYACVATHGPRVRGPRSAPHYSLGGVRVRAFGTSMLSPANPSFEIKNRKEVPYEEN